MSTAIEKANPIGLVEKYQQAFTSSLPSHINHDQWVAVVMGTLRSNQAVLDAAANDPGRFLAALLQAARLGLEPGTEQFYLVPNAPKKGMPRVILPVVGYQGLVELMYRAGAVASVIVECVYAGDQFDYVPGRDERPRHVIDWDAADRGALRLVYAYAIMKDGATSKVVVLNRADVERVKASSAAAASEYGPWKKHPAAMWMKTAARQLAKWVPTSAEFRRQQLRDVQTVQDERERRNATVEFPVQAMPQPAAEGEYIDPLTGEVVLDAEVVEEGAGEGAHRPVEGGPGVAPSSSSDVVMVKRATVIAIQRELARCGVGANEADSYLGVLGIPRGRVTDLTQVEAEELLVAVRGLDRDKLAELVADVSGGVR